MKLRRELMPPVLDEAKVSRLANLAARLDGRSAGWESALAIFNRDAGTAFSIEEFQGIYGAEEHETWVRRVLVKIAVGPAADITRQELAEVVRRAMPQNEHEKEHEAYMAIFDANVPMPSASNLIFYPPDYDENSNTWSSGKPICEYNPTPEQVVEWALSWQST